MRFWTTSPKPAMACGGGGPPAPTGQSGSRRRTPGWLHWQAGDGDSGVQLPLARMLATSAGTSGTEKWQAKECVHSNPLWSQEGLWVLGEGASRHRRGGKLRQSSGGKLRECQGQGVAKESCLG